MVGFNRVFIDTNIFIYKFDSEHPRKQLIVENVLRQTADNSVVFISTQVLKEVAEVCIRKLNLTKAETALIITEMSKMNVVNETSDLIKQALDIHFTHQYSFYDSLIIAAAASADCDTLYTEDMAHGQTVHGVKLVNPFE